MTETEKRIIGIAKKSHAEALAAAQNSHDAFSGFRAEQHGWKLVGIYTVLYTQNQTEAARQVRELIDDLHNRLNAGGIHALDTH